MKKSIIIVVIFLLIAAAGTAIGWYGMRLRQRSSVVTSANSVTPSPDQVVNAQNAWQKAVGAAVSTDADLDGVSDVDETKYKTNPKSADTDGDGVSDKTEIFVSKTDPNKADTDGDGVNDGWEIRKGTKPLDPKSF